MLNQQRKMFVFVVLKEFSKLFLKFALLAFLSGIRILQYTVYYNFSRHEHGIPYTGMCVVILISGKKIIFTSRIEISVYSKKILPTVFQALCIAR
jgi:hypothetical protein